MTEIPLPPGAWVTKLGALCGGAVLDADELKRRTAPLVQPLANRFPPRAFTESSLEHVAASMKRWPTYESIGSALISWIREHPEPRATLAPPEDPQLRAVHEQRAAAKADWSNPAKVRASVNTVLARVCNRCGAACRPENAADGSPCQECRGGVVKRHPMEDRMGGMLAGLVQMHAPQNLQLCLPSWIGKDWAA